LGMAFVAAIMILVTIGWLYEVWRRWANRYLEEVERDIRRTRFLKETDDSERAPSGNDREAA
jgi:hypothetical protein